MNTSIKYSPEVRERALRMVLEHRDEHGSQWAAIAAMANVQVLTACTLEYGERVGHYWLRA